MRIKARKSIVCLVCDCTRWLFGATPIKWTILDDDTISRGVRGVLVVCSKYCAVRDDKGVSSQDLGPKHRAAIFRIEGYNSRAWGREHVSEDSFLLVGAAALLWFTPTHCNTHSNTLQHTLQHTATHSNTHSNTLQHTLQHTATHTATRCSTLQHCARRGQILRMRTQGQGMARWSRNREVGHRDADREQSGYTPNRWGCIWVVRNHMILSLSMG